MRYQKEQLLYPIHLDMESTNYCDLKCIICPHSSMKRKQGFMSWEVLKKVTEESKGKTQTYFFQQIGEPLLHSECVPMVKYIRENDIWVGVGTNAMLLTSEISVGLFEARTNHITLCLDSLNKESYERIRKGAIFEEVVKNIDECIAIRKRMPNCDTIVVVQMIEMKENINEREQFKEFYNSKLKGIGRASVKPFNSFSGAVLCEKSHIHNPYSCTMLNFSMTIYWNGDAVICCHDYDGFTKVGNVLEQSVAEIWNNKQYNEYRRMHREKDFSELSLCKNCCWGGIVNG